MRDTQLLESHAKALEESKQHYQRLAAFEQQLEGHALEYTKRVDQALQQMGA